MGLLGTIIGGVLGWGFGGPLGAIIGGWIGLAVLVWTAWETWRAIRIIVTAWPDFVLVTGIVAGQHDFGIPVDHRLYVDCRREFLEI